MKRFLSIILCLLVYQITEAANPPSKVLSYLVGDGVTDQTVPLQKAIDSCSKAGGGTLIIPKGTYVISPITMNSNVNLYLDTLATLLGTPVMANYTVNGKLLNLIGGDSLHNVSITGKGTIDGNGAPWWAAFKANTSISRPRLVYLTKILNLTIDGITLVNSPSFHIVPNQCKNITINNITINTPSTAPNTDGIDPSNCINVYITNCTIGDGDDNIAVKAGRINGLQTPGTCQNINISNCTFLSGHGLSIGSETDDGVTGLTAKNCTFNGTTNGIRIKSAPGLGGSIQNVKYSNIKMTNVANPIIITFAYTSNTGTYPDTPSVKGFYIDSLTATGATGAAGSLIGLSNSFLKDISLKNINISAKTGLVLTDATGVTLCNVIIKPTSGQSIIATNVQFNPDTVETLTAIATGAASSKITWSVPCLSQVVEYGVFRSYDGKTFTLLSQIPGTVTNYQYQYTDASVNVCQSVYYKVGSYSTGNTDTLWSSVITLSNPAFATITPVSSTTFCSGENVVLNANTGTGLTYQWNNNGTAISGATTASYTASASGKYTVTIKNSFSCSETSSATTVTVNTVPYAPTVTTPVTYCQNATATALSVTGTGLLWYTTATGGTGSSTAPTPSTTTAGTTNYYVSQTTSGCESARSTIAVTVNATPSAPTVTTPVMYCQNATATALSATGTGLKWYTVATGGISSSTAPTPNTTTAGTTSYYVSQTTNGCESSRATIAVTVNALPTAPTVITPVTYCQNSTATALTANGTGLTWYTISTGGTGNTTAPTPSTTTTGATNYYVSQTANSCEGPRAAIIVTVNAIPNAPTVTTSVTYCQNVAVTALSATGTGLKWYMTATGGTGSSTAPTPNTSSAGTTNYYISQTTNSCESSRATITVIVNTVPAAPTVTTPVSYCQNATAAALSATGAGLKWYTIATGGTSSGTAPTPNISTVGTTNYYVSQTSNACESSRATIAVTVTAPTTWYQDLDGDGKGDPNVTKLSCTQPAGYVAVAGDACPTDPNKTAPGNCGCGKTEQSCLDCAGVPNGTAVKDSCGNCVGGTTGLTACTITTGTIGSINGTSIVVYPQPFENTTKVELKNGGTIKNITIYSSTGALVYTKTEINRDEAEVGESLADGLYNVVIQTHEDTYMIKIVKIK